MGRVSVEASRGRGRRREVEEGIVTRGVKRLSRLIIPRSGRGCRNKPHLKIYGKATSDHAIHVFRSNVCARAPCVGFIELLYKYRTSSVSASDHTNPSYNDKACHERLSWQVAAVRLTCTIVGSCFEPSLNSSNVSLESLFRSMIRKILSTRWGQL